MSSNCVCVCVCVRIYVTFPEDDLISFRKNFHSHIILLCSADILQHIRNVCTDHGDVIWLECLGSWSIRKRFAHLIVFGKYFMYMVQLL